MAKYVVASVDEVPVGGRKIVDVGGRTIGLFNVNGEFYALLNRCPHQAGPLCEGVIYGALESSGPGDYRLSPHGEIVTCPWHGWEFDIRTGQSWCDPERLRVRSYNVRVEAGSAIVDPEGAPAHGMVKGPYVAETFRVTTEGQYVVVDLSATSQAHRPARSNG